MAFTNFLISALFATHAFAVDTTVNPSLDASLFTAPTRLDHHALLENSDWVFDFNAQKGYTYSPGSVVNANAATFPASVGNGMTIAMLNLGPCAMLPAHFHPRATNLVVAIEGETNTYMIEENGATMVNTTLTPGKMTIFPKGSVHSMQNTGCGNSTLVSALNSEDSGTTNLVNALATLPTPLRQAFFGNPSEGSAAHSFVAGLNPGSVPAVGTGSILGDAACLAKCQISS